MKNLFKSVLAIGLALSLCVMSFAVEADSLTLSLPNFEATGNYFELDEDGYLKQANFELGKDLYIPIEVKHTAANTNADGGVLTNTCTLNDLKDFRIKSEIDLGDNVVGSISFVRVKKSAKEPTLAIKINIKNTYNEESIDVVGVLKFEAKHSNDFVVWEDHEDRKIEVPFAFTLAYDSEIMIDFDNDADFEIPVADHDSDMELVITGDGRGQDPLYILANNNVIDSYFTKYPNADLLFVNFEGNNKTFNRTCKLHIPYEYEDSDPYIYERTENGLRLIKGAYDVTDEEFVVATRTLGNYIISDRVLVAKDEAEVKPVLPINPPTGAVEDAEVEEVESNNSKVIVSTAICVLVLIVAILVLRKLKKDGKLNRKNK